MQIFEDFLAKFFLFGIILGLFELNPKSGNPMCQRSSRGGIGVEKLFLKKILKRYKKIYKYHTYALCHNNSI